MTKEKYMNERTQLLNKAKSALDAGNIEQFNAIKAEIEALDAEYEASATAQANYAALQCSAVVPVELQNLGGSMDLGSGSASAPVDQFDSIAYKQAFMNYAARGEAIPDKFRNAAATTTSTDAAAVIPTSWVKEIIRGLKERGVIFQQLRHMNIQGGVEIPILDLAPTASWVGESASEDQKIAATKTISFKYYGLECKIAQSILVGAVTLDAFQDLFVELATEAVVATVEKGVFTGTGSGQMLGVCKDPRVTKIVELTEEQFTSWEDWKKLVFSKIGKKYQTGKFYMAQGTFEGYIDGMVDINGQPVGRTNYGIADGPAYRFGGKDVETVEDDVLPGYDTASNGDVVAVFMNLKNYIFNSNMKMTVVTWTDNDNNKKKTKVMLICDGKAADTNGIILVKKKVTA